ncbi:hypothetical protein [Ferrimicrobium sp.]|uniref:hypothetical protein n=1 Tax=Ferrimicrobium sp. TaxID=2926050 RepID=UPI0026148CE1|nr:hypothetical protein [Ferrimicrobium sp.]
MRDLVWLTGSLLLGIFGMRDNERARLADLWHRRELAFQDWLLAKEQLNASTEQHRRITAAKTAAFRSQGISEAQLARYRSWQDHPSSPRDPRTIERYARWRSVITLIDAQWESKLSVATVDLKCSTLRLVKATSELLSVMPRAMVVELSGDTARSLVAKLAPLGDLAHVS